MKNGIIAVILIFIFMFINYAANAEHCHDYLLLSGSEEVVQYGIDTTGVWWAVTSPLTEKYRLIIDGEESDIYDSLYQLTISRDGLRWACFAESNTGWQLLTNDTIIDLPGNDMGEIAFSPNSETLAYSYYIGEDETIQIGDKIINVMYRIGSLYLSYDGSGFAFLGMRNDMFVLNINGRETTVYDEIKPLGFWQDGRFLYAAQTASYWEIYKDDEVISDIYTAITDAEINNYGTVAVFLAYEYGGRGVSVLISDDYYNPVVGRPYDWVGDLALHPELELFAYKAKFMESYYVIFNDTEYSGGLSVGRPYFTHDGEEMYFFGCNVDCFVKVNGKRYQIFLDMDPGYPYAKQPGGNTIAYATSAAMVVMDITNGEMYSGTIIDEAIPPIYNWRYGRYETLAMINRRLFLLTCTF